MLHLDGLRAGLKNYPADALRRAPLADYLNDIREGWGDALRAACNLHHRVPGLTLPDTIPAFLTPSAGWTAVAEDLEALARDPADTDAFRHRYHRLVRGDIPLDPERLKPTLRLQYDLQLRLLESLGLLERTDDGDPFLTAIDGKAYPAPDFEAIFDTLDTPAFRTKLSQGFDTLLLVPFGLPLDRILDAWRDGLRRNAATLRSVGQFSPGDPLYAWTAYRAEPLVYDLRSFAATHGGRTKEQLLAERHHAWDVLLVEGSIPNIPPEGQGRTVGDRPQFECGRTPEESLADLRKRGESGLTPEAYAVQFLDALERGERVLDTETFSFLTGAFLPMLRIVPSASWFPGYGLALLDGALSGGHIASYGVRAAVRVRSETPAHRRP